MKKFELDTTREFTAGGMKRYFIVQDSPYFKIINFNLSAGHTFPVHSHNLDGELSILVLEGTGEFLGEGETAIPANPGQQAAAGLVSRCKKQRSINTRNDKRSRNEISLSFRLLKIGAPVINPEHQHS